jgi:hypothetical protein
VNPALAEIMETEFHERPWGGAIDLNAPKPPEPPPITLEIPPPPWAGVEPGEAPVVDEQPDPLPRPQFPPPPWARASKADEEVPNRYPPAARSES